MVLYVLLTSSLASILLAEELGAPIFSVHLPRPRPYHLG